MHFWKVVICPVGLSNIILKGISLGWEAVNTFLYPTFGHKNKDLTAVLRKIDEFVNKHPNFLKKLKYESETGFRYSFHHKNDKERELLLTILVFDIPND